MRKTAIVLESMGMGVMLTGIVLELKMREPIWMIVFAVGALFCTCGGYLWAKFWRQR